MAAYVDDTDSPQHEEQTDFLNIIYEVHTGKAEEQKDFLDILYEPTQKNFFDFIDGKVTSQQNDDLADDTIPTVAFKDIEEQTDFFDFIEGAATAMAKDLKPLLGYKENELWNWDWDENGIPPGIDPNNPPLFENLPPADRPIGWQRMDAALKIKIARAIKRKNIPLDPRRAAPTRQVPLPSQSGKRLPPIIADPDELLPDPEDDVGPGRVIDNSVDVEESKKLLIDLLGDEDSIHEDPDDAQYNGPDAKLQPYRALVYRTIIRTFGLYGIDFPSMQWKERSDDPDGYNPYTRLIANTIKNTLAIWGIRPLRADGTPYERYGLYDLMFDTMKSTLKLYGIKMELDTDKVGILIELDDEDTPLSEMAASSRMVSGIRASPLSLSQPRTAVRQRNATHAENLFNQEGTKLKSPRKKSADRRSLLIAGGYDPEKYKRRSQWSKVPIPTRQEWASSEGFFGRALYDPNDVEIAPGFESGRIVNPITGEITNEPVFTPDIAITDDSAWTQLMEDYETEMGTIVPVSLVSDPTITAIFSPNIAITDEDAWRQIMAQHDSAHPDELAGFNDDFLM